MNIFYLDKDPYVAAYYHCNKHVVKMILESAQMLASAYYVSNGITSSKIVKSINFSVIESIFKDFPRIKDNKVHPYGIGYVNHPSTVWSYSNLNHWKWLLILGEALINEYSERYGKYHKVEPILNWMRKNPPNLESNKFQPPPLAMPDECKSIDHVKSYRNYYIQYKKHFAKWPDGHTPYWWPY